MVNKNLKEITEEEFDKIFEDTLSNIQNIYLEVMDSREKYLKDKYSGKYNIKYFQRGEEIFYTKHRKRYGFK